MLVLKTAKLKIFFIFLLTVIVISTNLSFSQYLPVITNESGDTINYTWPIPESALCIKDEIIIKFKANALNLNKLCYIYQGPTTITDPDLDPYIAFKNVIMNQQFPLDSIIADPALNIAMKQFGGIYLTRITSANPCTDTVSITRYGDTVKCENFLWMKLKLNNDTSMINACTLLTLFYQYLLEGAEPNYCRYANRPEPVDTYFQGADLNSKFLEQKSLKEFYTNTRRAWDFQVGNEFIKVGIIDNGIDWYHCDLGSGFGEDAKVVDGYNYFNNNANIVSNSGHGTKVAGIIGALTDGSENCPHPGSAGIAGGWKSDGKLGCKLYGFKVGHSDDEYPVDKIIAAMREGASDYNHEAYGLGKGSYRVHILNCSYGDTLYSEAERSALNFAFEQGVSIVASRGNEGTKLMNYPSTYDQNWVCSVGGHGEGNPENNILPERWNLSSYGLKMDLIAPSIDVTIVAPYYEDKNTLWDNFGWTSAAAPHLAGGIALLRSEFYENPNHCLPSSIKPEPEDFENMFNAAALDLNYSPNNQIIEKRTYVGYDNVSGWGQLKIGRIFEMLAEGYVLKHYKITEYQPEDEYQIIEGGIAVHAEGLRRDVATMAYPIAERRTVSGSITLEDNWVVDGIHSLYVWGRNGRSMKGGFGKANPLYLTSYTEVTSGEGGNGLVPGIIHNSSLIVNAKTYQYRLNNAIDLPTNNNIELYISVFGKPKPTSVGEISNMNRTTLFPNPSCENVILKFKTENICSPIIRIFNYLGNLVEQISYGELLPDYHEIKIDTKDLTIGS